MKVWKWILFFGMLFLLTACGTSNNGTGGQGTNQDDSVNIDEGVQDLTGYIIQVVDNRILVTGVNELYTSGKSATWYTIEDSTQLTLASGREPGIVLEVGMKVEVWNTGIVLESFPSQATAVKIIVDDSQLLDERKAIGLALEKVEKGQPWLIEEVNQQDKTYIITVRNLLTDDEEEKIEIEL